MKRTKITKDKLNEISTALMKNDGNLSFAASEINVTRRVLKEIIFDHKELQDTMKFCDDRIVAIAEIKLLQAIAKNKLWAIRLSKNYEFKYVNTKQVS